MTISIFNDARAAQIRRSVYQSTSAIATSSARLSSGLRVNSAKDDAAGLAISERLTSQVRGSQVAQRNIMDTVSALQIAEGAMSSISEMQQRLRELAVQAANATLTASDRAALDVEANGILRDIFRAAKKTSFNGEQLLTGQFKDKVVQAGPASSDRIQNVSVINSKFQLPPVIMNLEGAKMGALWTQAQYNDMRTSSPPTWSANLTTLSGSQVYSGANASAEADRIAEIINQQVDTPGWIDIKATASSSFELSGMHQTQVLRSIGFTSANSLVGPGRLVITEGNDATGTFVATTGSTPLEVSISAQDTLADIRDKINAAAVGGAVVASLVSTSQGTSLELRARAGNGSAIQVSAQDNLSQPITDGSGLGALAYPALAGTGLIAAAPARILKTVGVQADSIGLGSGSLTLTFGSDASGSFVQKASQAPISIPISNTDSLSAVRDRINAATAGTGLSVSIVPTSAGLSRLELRTSAGEMGALRIAARNASGQLITSDAGLGRFAYPKQGPAGVDSVAARVSVTVSSKGSAFEYSADLSSIGDLSPLWQAMVERRDTTGFTILAAPGNGGIQVVAGGATLSIKNFRDSLNPTSMDVVAINAQTNTRIPARSGGSGSITLDSSRPPNYSPDQFDARVTGIVQLTSSAGKITWSDLQGDTTSSGGARSYFQNGPTGSFGSDGVELVTQAGARLSLDLIDAEIDRITSGRASVGAQLNRMDAVYSQSQVFEEAMAASRGQIMDADYAVEQSNLLRSKIIQQAGMTILSQANISPSVVMNLLKS